VEQLDVSLERTREAIKTKLRGTYTVAKRTCEMHMFICISEHTRSYRYDKIEVNSENIYHNDVYRRASSQDSPPRVLQDKSTKFMVLNLYVKTISSIPTTTTKIRNQLTRYGMVQREKDKYLQSINTLHTFR
jgi:hypothetical protein